MGLVAEDVFDVAPYLTAEEATAFLRSRHRAGPIEERMKTAGSEEMEVQIDLAVRAGEIPPPPGRLRSYPQAEKE